MFEEWKSKELHQNTVFISDGIIDKSCWDESQYKILFLLKEAYSSDPTERSWDLRNFIKERGVFGRTFKPMAQWAYGIEKILQNREISPYVSNSKEVRNALLSSAVVNLKKSGGKNKSGYKNLQKYVAEDWGLISKQIAEISPKVIVCGNTWSLIKDELTSPQKVSDCAFLCDGILYIDYWHPSNRAANLMNYYSICAIVQIAINAVSAEL